MSSSRQLVGWMGEELKNDAPVVASNDVGIGIIVRSACTLGSFALNPGTAERFGVGVPPMVGQSEKSSFPGVLVDGFGQTSVKSPALSAAEGTATLKTCPGTRSLRHSCDQKKNVFCLLVLYTPGMKIGPPMVYPKSCFL